MKPCKLVEMYFLDIGVIDIVIDLRVNQELHNSKISKRLTVSALCTKNRSLLKNQRNFSI